MAIQDLIEGKIDFEGQRFAEQIIRVVLIAATGISFILGFALQSMKVTVATFGLSTIALAVVVAPPWPWYNRHPVKWLPVKKQKT